MARKKKEHDFALTAFRVMQEATREEEPSSEEEQPQEAEEESTGKNPAAVALGRLGGKKGGKARAAKLTPEERKDIARRAAQARWANRG